MNKYLAIAATLAAVAFPGSAHSSATLTSAQVPVIAILQDDLFIGDAVGYMDRTGTIDIKSAIKADLRCVGKFRYTSWKTGIANVQCNDGHEVELSFSGLSLLSGYGHGKSPRGPVSFTFGLPAEEAGAYLKLPAGKKIVTRDKRVEMVDL